MFHSYEVGELHIILLESMAWTNYLELFASWNNSVLALMRHCEHSQFAASNCAKPRRG